MQHLRHLPALPRPVGPRVDLLEQLVQAVHQDVADFDRGGGVRRLGLDACAVRAAELRDEGEVEGAVGLGRLLDGAKGEG